VADPTKLLPVDEAKPPWTLFELAGHFDISIGLTVMLMAEPQGVAVTAAILDELLARRTVPGHPADLVGDDLAWVRAASGRGPAHPDPRLPLIG
jgi:hypothetical protein